LECCNLKAESMLITIKDSDATLAGHLEGRVCNNFMSIWCLVDVSFGLFNPDKALIWALECLVDFLAAIGSDSQDASEC
jgi:hypothetical protein